MKTFGVIAVLALVLAGVASAGLPTRLSKAQWAAYSKANTAFTTQTPKSVARFRYCLSSTTGSRDARAMQRCFGNTADLELTATQNLFTRAAPLREQDGRRLQHVARELPEGAVLLAVDRDRA